MKKKFFAGAIRPGKSTPLHDAQNGRADDQVKGRYVAGVDPYDGGEGHISVFRIKDGIVQPVKMNKCAG